MNISEARSKIRAVMLSLTAVIIVFLVFRLVFLFFDASASNFFVSFINSVSDIFIGPFEGISGVIENRDILDTFIAILAYVFAGVLIAEVLTSFIYDEFSEIFLNLVDAFFKIIESILFIRIVSDFFQLDRSASFLDTIYGLTDWSSGIFSDLLVFDGRLNISAIVVLIGIIFLDLISESILINLFFEDKKFVTKKLTVKSNPVPTQQPVHQNITINVPPTNFQYPNQFHKPVQQRPMIPKSVSVSTVPKAISTTNNYYLPQPQQNYQQPQFMPQRQVVVKEKNVLQKAWSGIKEFFGS